MPRWPRRWPAMTSSRQHPFNATRAITIGAPPGRVWPWIVQIGYGRAGLYTYDLVDNGG
jgi:hypothetical protein